MKLLQSCSLHTWCNHIGIDRTFRVFSYSTETASASALRASLYGRILPLGNPKVSITPVLNQWVQEEGGFDPAELRSIIKRLRKFRRFSHALEVSEWMSSKSYPGRLPSDVADQLDLISKVHGLEQAEQYFKNIPNDMIGFHVYGALLNCYARAKSLDKAEATLQKMRELGFLDRTTLSYNVMLNLYSQTGKHEKLYSLVREMEEKGINGDKFTFGIQISSYANIPNIKGMEEILMKMEADPEVSMDWTVYAQAANGYLKAGLVEKALAMLKKSEHLIRFGSQSAHKILLTQYGRMGKIDEVYRIWNLCKKYKKIYNPTYLCMTSSVAKLGDLEGMEKIFEEWEAAKTSFDIRLPNLLISTYCRNGLLDKAEVVVKKLIESGRKPDVNSWIHLAAGYCKHDLTQKVIDTMKEAILARDSSWRPNLDLFAKCVEYLEGKGDMEVREFRTFLEEKGYSKGTMET